MIFVSDTHWMLTIHTIKHCIPHVFFLTKISQKSVYRLRVFYCREFWLLLGGGKKQLQTLTALYLRQSCVNHKCSSITQFRLSNKLTDRKVLSNLLSFNFVIYKLLLIFHLNLSCEIVIAIHLLQLWRDLVWPDRDQFSQTVLMLETTLLISSQKKWKFGRGFRQEQAR